MRACDDCRRMKEKCEGGTPCRREQLAKADFQDLIDRSKYMERILKRKIKGIRLDSKSLAELADSLDADGGNVSFVGSDAQEMKELVMDDETCTMDPKEHNTTHFSGEFSYWNFSMRLKQQFEQMGGLESRNTSDSNRAWDFPRAHQLRPGRDHLSAAMSCCPPRPIAEFLVRTFFKYVETHYFLVEETWLLERMSLLYEDRGSFNTKKGSEVIVSILLTVFAIGSQYAHLESSTSKSTTYEGQAFAEEDIGAIFYQQAIRLLPEIIEQSSLESVQACLLFGYYALPVDTSGLGYIYVNLAIRLAMQNGMHRRCKNTAFTATMIETRNRIWWTTYLLDRKISIFHGRPLSVLRTETDATLPVYRPELESVVTRTSVTRTGASIQLIHFLEVLFDDIRNLRSCRKHQIPEIISSLLTSKLAMGKWWSSLPRELMSIRLQPAAQVRSVMHLQLEYCLVRMFTGRPFLLKKNMSESMNKSPANPDSSAAEKTSSPAGSGVRYPFAPKELVDDCIKSATEALDLLQELRDCGLGLARASYIEYSSCRASLLVLIAHSIQSFSEHYRTTLYKGLDMIREMSAAGESAQSEVSLIEALERALARLHSGVQLSQQDQIVLPERPISDYEAFKHWGAIIREDVAFKAPNLATPTSDTEDAILQAGQSRDFDTRSYDRTLDMEFNHAFISLSDNQDMDLLGALEPILEQPNFGATSSSFSAAWPTWTESQVLERFLTNPEYGPNQGMDIIRE
ncbi:hypothetical protein VI817_006156 [Penicillium citrinum]|nr:hypothetical protein VI817_006156 [Penicillium citrinum]